MVLRRAKDDEKDDEKDEKDDKDKETLKEKVIERRVAATEPLKADVGTLTPVVGAASVLGEVPNQPATREMRTLAEAGAQAVARGVAAGEPHRVLLWGEGGVLTPCDVTGPKNAREIMVADVPYDHVDTDWESGLWIYRNDRKN